MNSDSDTWFHYLPVLEDNKPYANEGDVILYRDGRASMGNTSFPPHASITEHHSSGCVAKRGADSVLEITTPIGAVYRYKYALQEGIWYKLVPTTAPTSVLAQWLAEAKGFWRQYGFMVGSVLYLLYFFVTKVVLMYVYVMALFLICMYLSSAHQITTPAERVNSFFICTGLTWLWLFLSCVKNYAWQWHKVGLIGLFGSAIVAAYGLWPVLLTRVILSALNH